LCRVECKQGGDISPGNEAWQDSIPTNLYLGGHLTLGVKIFATYIFQNGRGWLLSGHAKADEPTVISINPGLGSIHSKDLQWLLQGPHLKTVTVLVASQP